MSERDFLDFCRDFFGIVRRDGAADAQPSTPPPPLRRVMILLRGGDDDYHRLYIDGGDTNGIVKAVADAMAANAPIVTVGTTTLRVSAIDAVYEAAR